MLKFSTYILSFALLTLGFGRESNRSEIKLTTYSRDPQHKVIRNDLLDEQDDLERKRSIKRRRKMRKPKKGLR